MSPGVAPAGLVTVAMKVILWPKADGFGEDVSEVVDGWSGGRFTTCFRFADELPA